MFQDVFMQVKNEHYLFNNLHTVKQIHLLIITKFFPSHFTLILSKICLKRIIIVKHCIAQLDIREHQPGEWKDVWGLSLATNSENNESSGTWEKHISESVTKAYLTNLQLLVKFVFHANYLLLKVRFEVSVSVLIKRNFSESVSGRNSRW